MDPFQPFEVKVPGSTANLGSGFDSIGMAVDRNLRLRVSPSERLSVTVRGEDLKNIMKDGDNLILEVMRETCLLSMKSLPPLHLEVESDIPLMRGLGSSAAAIVAGLVAANHLLGRPFDRQTLFQQAVRREGHPDNVGASLFGGVVISSWDGEKAYAVRTPVPPFYLVAAIPGVPLATARAREVLPDTLSHREAVLGSSRANLLTAALLTRDWEAFRVGLMDRFHQPFRAPLVPGLNRVLNEAVEHGALGAALSGAGPTVVAFALDPEPVRQFMERVFEEEGVPAEIMVLRPGEEGARVRLTDKHDRSTLIGNLKGARR
ncbi:homoserine kinase [Melghirimyces profundicolus]|uniref:Homoserine kinase n=1 Tax=Melghirimyces profundicolus TaxID=1242148 RepID=A0A2T6BGW5_9BACL|nr:homoserine kinase [Melghirimyces profundicolus]PTX55300.1 homoserine kinase [Melghirimyces profundicolus]